MTHFSLHTSLFLRLRLRFLALFVALAACAAGWGQDVSLAQARQIAADFFAAQGVASAEAVELQSPAKRAEAAPYYIFNSADSAAFAVVSGDERTLPILAYSTDGPFDPKNIGPGAADFLRMYESYIEALKSGDAEPAAPADIDWGAGRLITTAKWNQSYDFWWSDCPKDGGEATHAGCVATAMAILMKHYDAPAAGAGSKTYTTKSLRQQLSARFDQPLGPWAALPMGNQDASGWTDDCQRSVARLLYLCGVAANMDYTTDGSAATDADQSVGLYRYFGYSLGDYVDKSAVSDEEWARMIKDETDAGRPILYRGTADSGSGHAYICDGYNSLGQLHFNFGWGGTGDGFYTVLGAEHSCGYRQGMTVGCRPEGVDRPLSDLYLRRGFDKPTGIVIGGDGVIRRGQTFELDVYNLLNTSDADLTLDVALFVTDAGGKRKQQAGEYAGLSLPRSGMVSELNFFCSLPYSYQPEQGDCLRLFYRTAAADWQPVPCTDRQAERVLVEAVYDGSAKHLQMIEEEGKGLGLELLEGNTVNQRGMGFGVRANCVMNLLAEGFDGEVAVWLTDSRGKMKAQVGAADFEIVANAYTDFLKIACVVTSQMGMAAGDCLALYSKNAGEKAWAPVFCDDPERATIGITEEMLTAQPQQLLMASEQGLRVKAGKVKVGGGYFTLSAIMLQNVLASAFAGEVAAFVCDAEGNRLARIGTTSISKLPAASYYENWYIDCLIPEGTALQTGCRIGLFSKMQGDDQWTLVACADPAKEWLPVPQKD